MKCKLTEITREFETLTAVNNETQGRNCPGNAEYWRKDR